MLSWITNRTLICVAPFLQELQDCFENKDIGRLQDVLLKMPKEEAEYHMKRCVESGMWVPDANKSSPGEDAEAADSEEPEK